MKMDEKLEKERRLKLELRISYSKMKRKEKRSMGLSILIFGAVRRKKLLPRRIMDILWWYLICHCFWK